MTDFKDELPEDIRLAIKASAPRPDGERVERVWERLQANFEHAGVAGSATARLAGQTNAELGVLRAGEVRGTPPASMRKEGMLYRGRVRRWVGYAFTSVACLSIVFALLWSGQLATTNAIPATRIFSTIPGQRSKIVLESGTQVILGPSTNLSVTGMDVSLDGQAVFTIVSNSASPFTVRTNQAVVKVLGTTFSVRAYERDGSTHVVVAEGKVSVNRSVLSVSDAADVSLSGEVIHRGVDIMPEFSWTEGRLVFNETPLSEAVAQLERWYSVQIDIVGNDLTNRPVTNTFFQRTLTANELDLFAQSLGLQYRRFGNRITLSRR